jgi:hypothetical protein
LYKETPVVAGEEDEKSKKKKKKKKEKEKDKKKDKKKKKKSRRSSISSSDEEEVRPRAKAKYVWSVACITLQDWNDLIEKYSKSKKSSDKELHETLSESFLPEIVKVCTVNRKAFKSINA